MTKNKPTVNTATGITRKKPWNRVNLPVYSICSRDAGGKCNMHIITYSTAVSMMPKQFVCCVYEGTKTLENINSNGHFILQILSATQYRLVDLLGKKSGHLIDKISRLEKRNLLSDWNGFKILAGCLAVMEMKVIYHRVTGDHTMFVCDMVAHKNLNNGVPLMLDILRAHKLTRI